ncbi:dienelactone hydrolase family protein [Larkinella rosea]|uniref:Dienelactone hydrolase family protein n=1 Tax=Larkinella rosea TaxID=2025312 RepID=A0A3P1BCE9_9BACT|nr:dienelactone hydrolase family protein [Larkinella rosea]RRA98545.1 dienelactone hydrolase family protein [Larkinella rosea]
MKKLLLLASGLFISLTSFGQAACCDQPVAEVSNDMALLASNHSFVMLHEEPLPFTYQSAAGEMVKFKTADGTEASGFLLKAPNASNKWLFVYQEWWGLNDYIKQEAEKLYNDLKDVNVLAVDMYDGKVATTREEASKLVQVPRERLGAIMQGAIAYAGPQAQIANVGWCFGGGMSLQSAILGGKQTVGCVMYYGQPEKNIERLKTLNTDVLGIFGAKDTGISPATVSEFEKNMKEAGKETSIKMYDAPHAFANPSNPGYNKEATADAYQITLDYLKKHLKV